nr:MAG TPA: hypothetical protein [Caudoviricetes sp.]
MAAWHGLSIQFYNNFWQGRSNSSDGVGLTSVTG